MDHRPDDKWPRILDGDVLHRSQKTSGHQFLRDLRGVTGGVTPVDQLVSGELLEQKLVVRLVRIQGVDHVVAVPPLVFDETDWRSEILVECHGVGIARHIEPVAPPADAKLG